MIKVTIQKNNREYKAVFCEGHAGFDDPGKDIVCAAVSILLINTANSIERFTDSFLGSDEDDGVLRLVLKDHPDEKANVLIDALILGLESIQSEYGKKFLEIENREV